MRFYESRYVATMAAAMVSKTGKIGYIASVPIPEVIRGINVAALAARKVNPEAVVIHTGYMNGQTLKKSRGRELADRSRCRCHHAAYQ